MSTTVLPALPAAADPPRPATHRGGARHLLAGQWVAVRSLRSTWWVLGGAAAAMVLFGVLFTATADSGGPAGNGGGPPGLSYSDPVGLSLGGTNLAGLVLGVLGVLLVTGEHSSGAVRVLFAAVPRRWPVVLARAAVTAALAEVVVLAAALTAFLVGQAVLGDAGVGLGDPGAARAVVGTSLYLTALALLGSALGWLLRSTAGAVGTLVGLVFLLPVLGGLLPSSWGPDVVRWLPGQAGSAVTRVVTAADSFAPWTGFAVLCGWVAVLTLAAVAVVRRRDV